MICAEEDQAGRHLQLHGQVWGVQHARANHSRKNKEHQGHQRAGDQGDGGRQGSAAAGFCGIDRTRLRDELGRRQPQAGAGHDAEQALRALNHADFAEARRAQEPSRQHRRCQRQAARHNGADQRPECADRKMHRDGIARYGRHGQFAVGCCNHAWTPLYDEHAGAPCSCEPFKAAVAATSSELITVV